MSTPLISNVSDTARWVATYRAWESVRPDALFRDPYAGRLAGERGLAMVKMMPKAAANGWPIILRTKLIDDLVLASIAQGCDCVVNLAAGFDTRPYRLQLPSSLLWIEADLPPLIEEKARLLAEASPVCKLSRYAVDLSDAAARTGFLDEVGQRAAKALVITEGLLVYLDDQLVSELAADLHQRPALEWWLFDLASPALLRLLIRSMGASGARAPMKFGPANGVEFFERRGWRALEIQSITAEAVRLRRTPFVLTLLTTLLPMPNPRRPGNARWNGVVRLRR
jgi:methyltransferase (TIGR00027 family)